MKKITKLILAAMITTAPIAAAAQQTSPLERVDNPEMLRRGERINIRIPDIDGYRSLKADFHIHTVFSDGSVWPTVRVDEAWRNGLDIIAITDHIEYRSHTDYLKGDHNTSYDIAAPYAKQMGIQLIKAAELTHGDKAKGGHINALFITDANPLQRPPESQSLQESVDEACRQGAYLIWNHPGWPNNGCQYHDISAKWVSEGKIQAVELFNEKEYYPRAATWCKEHNLAPVAASDVHAPINQLYMPGAMHPFTVVLAKDNTMESIREALNARRTIAIFNGQAVATAPLLEALFQASIKLEILPNGNWAITNMSSLPFDIRSSALEAVLLPDNTLQIVPPKAGAKLDIEVANLHITESENLRCSILPAKK